MTDRFPVAVVGTRRASAYGLTHTREIAAELAQTGVCVVSGLALGIDAAFIGANGILDGDVSTSNMEEGRIQQLAFSKVDTRYLIADSSRIGRRDFYTFCRLDNLDAVVCEPGIAAEDRAAIEEHTQVIC